MDRRKNIGILLAQPEESYQKKLLEGIIQQAFEYDFDCLVFASEYKQDFATRSLNGSMNIFELVNFDMLDAVVLVPDTIKYESMRNMLVDMIKERFDGPVVSADMFIDGFKSMDTDDFSVIEAECDHLIEEHGYTVIDFMSGILGHPHSVRRENGYRRSLEKHGIAFDERRIHEGDFWYNRGEAVADEILNSPLERPQAVLCASDSMAISLCDAFMKKGFAVPEDIAVMGYDNIEEAQSHNPPIASAELPAKQLGMRIVEYIYSSLANEEYVEKKYKSTLILHRSCGYHSKDKSLKNAKNYYDNIKDSYLFNDNSNEIMSKLIGVNNMHELFVIYQLVHLSDNAVFLLYALP
ncbi:MAG: substrate-binding domain-containing protein [Ruminococcus sp.]|nr:substrate-binding domain-containing protein [Ruminococcus sp.]